MFAGFLQRKKKKKLSFLLDAVLQRLSPTGNTGGEPVHCSVQRLSSLK